MEISIVIIKNFLLFNYMQFFFNLLFQNNKLMGNIYENEKCSESENVSDSEIVAKSKL